MNEKVKQPSLHWPGWVWVIFVFIGAPYTIVRTVIQLSGDIEIDASLIWPIICFEAIRYLTLALSILAAIMLLIKRKIGWILAIVTECIFVALSTYRLINWFAWENYKTLPAEEIPWAIILILLTVAIPVAWFVYFILARRRYGIGR